MKRWVVEIGKSLYSNVTILSERVVVKRIIVDSLETANKIKNTLKDKFAEIDCNSYGGSQYISDDEYNYKYSIHVYEEIENEELDLDYEKIIKDVRHYYY